ncbi:MAG: RHS repeat-associated core domain-containing protein, partial [Desulfobacteria bacterium]
FTAWSGTEAGNPYYFTGRRLDVLDNDNLLTMYYRHRTYDTYTARFLQQDPLGYVDGMNLYEYVKSNTVAGSDPYGLALALPPFPWPPPWTPHGEKPDQITRGDKKKAKKYDKCFCITGFTLTGYKSSPEESPFYGAHLRHGHLSGYWTEWDHCGEDGRADAHWWEWFNYMPTINPHGIYDDAQVETWGDFMSRRVPNAFPVGISPGGRPFLNGYTFPPDDPGVTFSPDDAYLLPPFEAYILLAAKSHPKCPCSIGDVFTVGAHVKVKGAWFLGGLNVSTHEADLYPGPFGWLGMPNKPTPQQIHQAFNKW